MQHLFRYTYAVVALSAVLSLRADTSTSDPGYVDFGKFSPASEGEFVEVRINSSLIAMASRLAEKVEPQVTDALRGLKQVQVNVIGLTEENRAEVLKRVEGVRQQLEGTQWERVVTAQQRDQDVRVYMKTRGSEAVEGLVVTVLEGKRHAVLLNVERHKRPEKHALIAERFHLEPLKKVSQALGSK